MKYLISRKDDLKVHACLLLLQSADCLQLIQFELLYCTQYIRGEIPAERNHVPTHEGSGIVGGKGRGGSMFP